MPTMTSVRIHPADLARVSSVGLRTRRARAALSALGIAIGVAAMVAVLGLSASSQAGLLAQIDQLGTNLLTVTPGQKITGEPAQLPKEAVGMIARIGPVETVQSVGDLSANVYRTPYVPDVNTNGIAVRASTLDLPAAVRTSVAQGRYLNAATAATPVVVLGSTAAERLGIFHLIPGERIWIGEQWFYVTGILNPATLAPEVDGSVFLGYPAAEKYLNFDGYASKVYVLTQPERVTDVYGVLAATANPSDPDEITVSRPSAALIARAAAQSAFNGLFLGLGAVALLVGGIGVANTMVISVLERRSEIGLRRSLGATRGDIRLQFLNEAILLAAIGGVVGVAAGVLATAVYAHIQHWDTVVPPLAWGGGLAASMIIGALAGLLPALRAARMSPTEALRTA